MHAILVRHWGIFRVLFVSRVCIFAIRQSGPTTAHNRRPAIYPDGLALAVLKLRIVSDNLNRENLATRRLPGVIYFWGAHFSGIATTESAAFGDRSRRARSFVHNIEKTLPQFLQESSPSSRSWCSWLLPESLRNAQGDRLLNRAGNRGKCVIRIQQQLLYWNSSLHHAIKFG